MSSSPDKLPEIRILPAKVSSGPIQPAIAESPEIRWAGEITSAILIPRWIVYFQAALLGIIATTFFVFGLMVGCLTHSQHASPAPTLPCEITGVVLFNTSDGAQPDAGAVVFFLPKQGRPEERGAGNLVSPAGFAPLNNPGIELVDRLGGAIVRIDPAGRFSVTIDGSRAGVEYFVLVVSKHRAAEPGQIMTKQQVAAIGTFFMPVDRVVDDRAYHWSSLTVRQDSELAKFQF